MEAMNLSADVKKQMQARLQAQEDEFLKARRKKMSVNDFETLTIIGRGAFGEVRVCRKKDDKKIYAMKVSVDNAQPPHHNSNAHCSATDIHQSDE